MAPRLVLSGCLLAAFTLAASAQEVQYIPRDLYSEQLLRDGNTITFCYNPDGMMADFEIELAEAIGSVLLVEANAVPLPNTQLTTPPLDYRLPLMPEQLFIVFAETCDALLGYALSASNPEWLSSTRPYMQTGTVVVVKDAAYQSLEDVPLDRPIGARAMSPSDNRLIGFIQARPEAQRWRRFPYYDNQIVMQRVLDDTLGAGIVWEPALYFFTDGDPAAAGFRILDLPFQTPSVDIGISTRSDNSYLNTTLSTAIEELVADGTIERLLQEHHLAPPAEGAAQ
jgi:polar amino acid transport system substrate-binding protein